MTYLSQNLLFKILLTPKNYLHMELRIDFAFLFQNFASEGCRIDLLVPNTVVSKHPGCLAGKYESCYTKLQQNH